MLGKSVHNAIHFWLLNAIALTMPLGILLNNICIIACLVNLLVSGEAIAAVKRMARVAPIWMMVVFYALHIISLFYSVNTAEGLAVLERKLVLVLFPIALFQPITESQFKRIGYTFAAGVAFALTYCLVGAAIQYNKHASSEVFFYHSLSRQIGMHAVYLSWYSVFSLFFLMIAIRSETKRMQIMWIAVCVLLAIGVVLLSSKMMLMLLVAGSVALVLVKQRRKVNVSMILATSLLLLMVLFIPRVRDRFVLELTSNFNVVHQNHYTYDTPFTGTTLRLTIWKHCLHILDDQQGVWLGVGTGDAQDLLNDEYKKVGMYTGNPQLHDTGYLGYGPHNQYMDILLTLGIVGLLVFCGMLALQFLTSIRSGDPLFILWFCMFLFFCMSESVLNTNKGVVFYAFFMVLFQARLLLSQQE